MSKRQTHDEDFKALQALSQEYMKTKETLASVMEASEAMACQLEKA
eukprot:CAMPEP_0202974674 /NCGR_PEP_ID=MMETSP1396-20130829/62707_1 /ASSEMBLY_ACC=CAM_ASM_000872 /TAXON_ID= /ORGANISM="Pseudokeronopsis sp., Strain Brazil" /LENGTH=45 /DNA_ID= /DNA_START= /DNA_END= /DNA_ORIENTATION=